MTDLAKLTAADFAACEGDAFALSDGAVLVLADVRELPARAGAPRTPFALTFGGPPGAVRPQGVRALAHDRLGTLELFLVPVGQDAQAVRYEAVFT